MEGLLIDLPHKPEYNLTIYSDLHLDAKSCAVKMLRAHMEARASLPNPIFALIGDVGSWILPTPTEKRHQSGQTIDEVATAEAQIDAMVDYIYKEIRGYPWLWLGIGNHEYTLLKGGNNVGKALVKRLNNPEIATAKQPYEVQYGAYTGFARLRFKRAAMTGTHYDTLYHHGAWGGQVQAVAAGFIRWANLHEGWDLAVYGHNHRAAILPTTRTCMSERGRIVHRDVCYANTGTFERGEPQSGGVTYAELKGLGPSFIGAPLIRLMPNHGSNDKRTLWEVSLGNVHSGIKG